MLVFESIAGRVRETSETNVKKNLWRTCLALVFFGFATILGTIEVKAQCGGPNGVAQVAATGGIGVIQTLNTGCQIRFENDPSTPWVRVLDTTSFASGVTRLVRVDPNPLPVTRTGKVRLISNVTTLTPIVVTQPPGALCGSTVSPSSFNVTSGAGIGTQTAGVLVNSPCTWGAYVTYVTPSPQPWIRIPLPNAQLNGQFINDLPPVTNATFNLLVDQNLTGQVRVGNVVIAGQTITITQSCNIALTPTSGNFAASGGNGSFTIRTDCPWSISSVPSWVTVTSGSSGPGNATVTFTVASNIGAARSGNIVVSGATYTVSQSRFIGNAATPGVYANGVAYLRNSNSAGFTDLAFAYGTTGDVPISGDWNGDGVDTLGIYRAGVFYLRNSNSTGPADIQFAFGISGDIPIAGDWDGDGIDTIGLVRGTTVFLRNSNSFGSPDVTFTYGAAGDLYLAGDWNGDGFDSIGIFRPSDGNFYLRNSNSTGPADTFFFFGQVGDKPIAGDWNADGVDTIGVFRENQWLLRNSNTTGVADIAFVYGSASDTPIVGDWNGLP